MSEQPRESKEDPAKDAQPTDKAESSADANAAEDVKMAASPAREVEPEKPVGVAAAEPQKPPVVAAAEPEKPAVASAVEPEKPAVASAVEPEKSSVATAAKVQEASTPAADAPKPGKSGEKTKPPTNRIRRLLEETTPDVELVTSKGLRAITRRDFVLYGAGVVAAAAGFWWILPDDTQTAHLTMAQQAYLDSLEARVSPSLAGSSSAVKTRFLNRVLTFDDDVAAALFSPDRSVPTFRADQVTPNLRNNYDGDTPDPGYIATWNLGLSGLASGKTEQLTISTLLSRFTHYDEITRLVCVEGWSAIASWGGLRFADLLAAYPPQAGAKWAKLISDVNLDSNGNSDPYYVSIDLRTASHPQTLLATHQNSMPLDVGHGAPMRLVAPMKLGLKNIKAVTRIIYSAEEPADYWNERGYSKYDGI